MTLWNAMELTVSPPHEEQRTGLVVIGASAGGVAALMTLVSMLPGDFPWAILIVLHIGQHRSVLPQLLSERGPLRAAHAQHEERIVAGRIYVAPPDRHLLVDDGHMALSKGPKEHFTRPAIDPLFLSTALAYGPMAIGVILSGTLEDGTAGLQAIKECGGLAVVQDPGDAHKADMPRSALKYVAVDHCVPVSSMAQLLVKLSHRDVMNAPCSRPPHLLHEQALALAQGNPREHLAAIGHPSTFVCPDCSGSLWQLDTGRPIQFRCHTGHAFTLKTLQNALAEAANTAMWTAVRALQEQGFLLETLIASHREAGEDAEAAHLEADGNPASGNGKTNRCFLSKHF